MNIFLLSWNPKEAAQFHNDKHVIKLILELQQQLSTAHRILDGQQYTGKSKTGRNVQRWSLPDERDDVVYQASFVNHPCNVWIRESCRNYDYVYELLESLHDEYTYRYGKVHKTRYMLDVLIGMPANLSIGDMTPPAQAMPDDVKHHDAVVAYREYYNVYKRHLASWKKRGVPEWYRSEV